MASVSELIDAFASKVEIHARMPTGSAAAEAAAVAMLKARSDLLMRYAEEVQEAARLKYFLVSLRNQINTTVA